MDLAIHRPGTPLDQLVESMTCFAGLDVPHNREKLIPDGAIELIVDLGDTPKRLYRSELGPVAADFRRAWISGMQRRPLIIEVQPGASLFVIRFRPGGAFTFLRHDAESLTDAVHDLEAVLGASSLRDRILSGTTPAERFAHAEAWLLERADGNLDIHPTVRYLAARLGHGRVGDLIETTGFTDRHVLSLFRRHLGLSPKQFARIQRFRTLLRSLRGGEVNPWLTGPRLPPQDWARLAAEHGYSDQSHLAHEFRALAGLTPGTYVTAYRGLENYLPIIAPPAEDFRFLQDVAPPARA